MEDKKIIERLFDEKNDDNLKVVDAEGNEIELEQVAVVTYEDKIYAVLHAIGDPEEEVLVFLVNPEDEESIIMIEDEKLANKILEIVMKESAE